MLWNTIMFGEGRFPLKTGKNSTDIGNLMLLWLVEGKLQIILVQNIFSGIHCHCDLSVSLSLQVIIMYYVQNQKCAKGKLEESQL